MQPDLPTVLLLLLLPVASATAAGTELSASAVEFSTGDVCDGAEEECSVSFRQLRAAAEKKSLDASHIKASAAISDATEGHSAAVAADAANASAAKAEAATSDKAWGHQVDAAADAAKADASLAVAAKGSGDDKCYRWTGGTCFMGKCDKSRGSNCKSGLCMCPETHCAKDGKCELNQDAGGGGIMKCEPTLEQNCWALCDDDNAACSWGKCKCKEGFCNMGGKCAKNMMDQWQEMMNGFMKGAGQAPQ